jgi:hypothetical protein
MKISHPEDIGLFVRDYRRDKGLSQSEFGQGRRREPPVAGEVGLVLRTLAALDLALDILPTPERRAGIDLDDVLRDLAEPRGGA